MVKMKNLVLLSFLLTQLPRAALGFFGTSKYAKTLIETRAFDMSICEKVGIDQEDAPLYIVAFMSSDALYDQSYGETYNVRLDQHGIEPWGDQFKTLINLTGFYGAIYDVAFNRNCTQAFIFMQTVKQIPGLYPDGFMPIIIAIDLENP